MKTEILRILKEDPEFLSGQALSERLCVSRTAVWKVMKQLKEEGYEIESVSNKGYRLITSPDLVTSAEVEGHMQTRLFGRKVTFLDETESTNTFARQLAEKEPSIANGRLVITEKQTSGKGRRGRGWESEEGQGIFMSLILKPHFSPQIASMMTLISALAVEEGIRKATGIELDIKWPNDLIKNGKKVCGILTELSAEPDFIHYIVIGIGINVNMTSFSTDIEEKATSLQLEDGRKRKRAPLIAAIMKSLEEKYTIFSEKEDLSDFVEEYNQKLVNCNQQVVIVEREQKWEALALGINKKGELLVKKEEEEIAISAGEVSVRGIYGYI